MIVTSNSLHFFVPAGAPLEGSGWQVRVRDYHDFTTLVAVMNEFVDLTVGPEHCGEGAGSVTVDLDSPFWDTTLPNGQSARTLLDRGYLWQAYEDGALRHEWIGRTVDERILDDNEAHVATISGPGTADVLRWAVIYRPGFPRPVAASINPETSFGSTDQVPAYKWRFPQQWPAMRMWWTLLKAAQGRGTVPWVTPLFTATADSGGVPWEYVPTIETSLDIKHGFQPTPGQNLLDFLNDCTGQDTDKHFAMPAEWVMRTGFRLDVRKTIGVHREKKVIFFEGGIQQKARTRTREEIANYVVAQDNRFRHSLATDATSVARWHRREALHGQYNIDDPGRRTAVANVILEQHKDEQSQWTIEVPYDQPGRRPFRDYHLGDWIGIARPGVDGAASTVEAFRVLAITVRVADQTTVELTLQSKLEHRQKQLERQLTTILHTIKDGTNVYVPIDTTVPPPTGTIPIGLDPDTGQIIPIPNLIGVSTGSGGSGGGVRVFIQDTDPGAQARPGDFWYDTNYTPEPEATYIPDPVEPAPEEDPDPERVHVPGGWLLR